MLYRRPPRRHKDGVASALTCDCPAETHEGPNQPLWNHLGEATQELTASASLGARILLRVKPEPGGISNKTACLGDRVRLGNDAGEVRDLDGKTACFEVWRRNGLILASAKLEHDFAGGRKLDHGVLDFLRDLSNRDGDDDLPSGCGVDQVPPVVHFNEHGLPIRDQRKLRERAGEVVEVLRQVAYRLPNCR